jgi:hypothetical protein
MNNLAQEITEFGTHQADSAQSYAQAWRDWADRLYDLAQSRPGLFHPRYMADDGERSDVALSLHGIDLDEITIQLDVIRTQADAITAALDRAARRVRTNTTASAAIVSDWEESRRDRKHDA